ncbi:MAG TPA: hypothetical protein PKE20_14010 [Promineifilum sp.]|nr:hypothetical protein [Promineifilum sp.]
MDHPVATLTLKQGRGKPVRNRHPWVFSGAIDRVKGQPAPGDLVTVADHKGTPLATAYYNPKSQIQARILSWDPTEAIDEAFWRGRLQRAIAGRAMMGLTDDGRPTTGDGRRPTDDGPESERSAPAPLITDPLTTPHSPLPAPHFPPTTACRLVNAEADGLPGLVVDRYGDYLVISASHSASTNARSN